MSGNVVKKIHELVCEQLGVDRGALSQDANILDDLGADSLDLVELIMALEEAFDLEIDDDVMQSLRTVGDVEEFIVAGIAA